MVKVETVSKPWGQEEILIKTKKYVMKRITINAGHRMSLQYHEQKEETIYVLSGSLIVWSSIKFRDNRTYCPGEVIHIPAGTVHRFGAPEQGSVSILECSTTELNDVVRLADDYNRT
jgi:mannose-6-phosphate isomerase